MPPIRNFLEEILAHFCASSSASDTPPTTSARLQSTSPLQVAIVGAGIGGTMTAYELSRQLGAAVNLTVFEPGIG